ncbi:MAG TPA: CvpA family protein [Burkholderiales bacterium]|nr:CvpA family protein [Burkholderiales bacterium]
MLTPFDYAVLAIIGLSVLVGIMRGAVREILALASWILAFMAARFYALPIAGMLPATLGGEGPRLLVAFIGVFLAAWLVMGVISVALSGFVKLIGLRSLDRSVGLLFGFGRGIFVVMLLVLIAGMTTLPREPFWRDAMLSPPLEAAATSVKSWLPSELAGRIRYE